ncbi:MAG: Pyridoxal-5'-phosphate-dependent protein beta subunit [candidate division TM6 bacterium GW2011_GWF2_38_10]|nr:MAG: Pyridoxal-5'-phosphate-dependent protein beta subunit [candidate division TM6 bacterium GW2011_GWF2_38_10]
MNYKSVILALLLSYTHALATTPPLLKKYHILEKKLPHVPLGKFPTPIKEVTAEYPSTNVKHIFIKQDTLGGGICNTQILPCSSFLRKLEFLLADMIMLQASTALTDGIAGELSAFESSWYCKPYLTQNTLMLTYPQQKNTATQDILIELCKKINTNCLCFSSKAEKYKAMLIYARVCANNKEPHPYLIPHYGSTEIGNIGFVNAAFELNDQLKKLKIPTPNTIYIPFYDEGAAAGLILGCKAAGLESIVIPIILNNKQCDTSKFLSMIQKTNKALHHIDPSFPLFAFTIDDVILKYQQTLSWHECIAQALNDNPQPQSTLLLWDTQPDLDAYHTLFSELLKNL